LQNIILEKDNTIAKMEKTHKNLLYRRNYHKFNKGTAFYIVKTKDDTIKVGFDGEDINARFETYRTLVPDFELLYIVYSPDAYLIEQNILKRFNGQKQYPNHEIIKTVNASVQQIIESVNTLISFCNFEANIAPTEEIIKYNISAE